MQEIHVQAHYASPPESVFAVLSDHETFLRGDRLQCEVIERGQDQCNGLGAVRRVDAGNLVFHEHINRFDPPHCYEYRIRSLTGWLGRWIPLDHRHGRIELTADGNGTRVDWTSRFRIRLPLLGPVLERSMSSSLDRAFSRLLERARPTIEQSDTVEVA